MKQKIKRVCTVHPVDPPGKFDVNLRRFTADEWLIDVTSLGVLLTSKERLEGSMLVPMSNIASIDYE